MMARTVARSRLGRWITKILDKTRSKAGRALALLSIRELESRGKQPTLSNIVDEARRIIEQTEGLINWGISKNEYTASLASAALRDLVEMGIVEERLGVYKIKKSNNDSPLAGVEATASVPYELILMRR